MMVNLSGGRDVSPPRVWAGLTYVRHEVSPLRRTGLMARSGYSPGYSASARTVSRHCPVRPTDSVTWFRSARAAWAAEAQWADQTGRRSPGMSSGDEPAIADASAMLAWPVQAPQADGPGCPLTEHGQEFPQFSGHAAVPPVLTSDLSS
jgi:hypothetical protein